MRELCDYIVRILESYFPGYYRNKKAGLLSSIDAPFSQKAAVGLLVLLVRTRLIYLAARAMSRKKMVKDGRKSGYDSFCDSALRGR